MSPAEAVSSYLAEHLDAGDGRGAQHRARAPDPHLLTHAGPTPEPILPVATVPRFLIVKTSSTTIWNGPVGDAAFASASRTSTSLLSVPSGMRSRCQGHFMA